MTCPSCGVEVTDLQKFCHECGGALPLPLPADPEPLDPPDPSARTDETDAVDTVFDPPAVESTTETAATAATAATTEPIDVVDEVPDPDAPTEPLQAMDEPPDWDATTPMDEPPDPDATTPMTETPHAYVTTPMTETSDGEATTETEVASTAAMPASAAAAATATEEFPATFDEPVESGLFDGHDDLAAFPAPREPFQIRLSFVLAVFAAVAMIMAIVADVIDIRTTRPVAGISTGAQTLDDIGTNLGVAGLLGAAVMVIGGLLACFGLRWGAGLAGGAGLAVLGWAGLTIGLAEFPIAVAESITRTSAEEFTLRVTRDLGWWLIAGVGALGLLVFVASLRSIGTGGRIPLNPFVAALTAVAATVLAFGPLVPVGNATFADNFRSVDPNRDLPTAFFAGRLGQVALIAAAGAVGMLIVRTYGVGLAVGGITVATWMWASSIAELGDRPIGIADRNPGADDTVPHAVTTTGMVSVLVLLALAGILAIVRNRRRTAQ